MYINLYWCADDNYNDLNDSMTTDNNYVPTYLDFNNSLVLYKLKWLSSFNEGQHNNLITR